MMLRPPPIRTRVSSGTKARAPLLIEARVAMATTRLFALENIMVNADDRGVDQKANNTMLYPIFCGIVLVVSE